MFCIHFAFKCVAIDKLLCCLKPYTFSLKENFSYGEHYELSMTEDYYFGHDCYKYGHTNENTQLDHVL